MREEYMIERQGSKLCECGCGRPAPIATRTNRRFGWVKGQPTRFVRGHATRRDIPDYVADENGCWIWQRGLSKGGYGLTGTGADAHRKMYEDQVGPIPQGMELDHLCRVRACVNPQHLEPVAPRENTRRGAGLGGLLEEVSRRASYRRARKLTPEQVHIIRSSERSVRNLAQQLGVSHETVRAVRNRTHYKEV